MRSSFVMPCFFVLILCLPGLNYASVLSVTERSNSIRTSLTGGGKTESDGRTSISASDGDFDQAVDVELTYAFEEEPDFFTSVNGRLVASQNSRVSTQGIQFNSRWNFFDRGFFGRADVSTEMTVRFELAEDTPFSLSWFSDGSRRVPFFQTNILNADQLIRLTRNETDEAFVLIGDFKDTVQQHYLFGSLIGRPTFDDQCIAVPGECPSFPQDTISGFLQAGQYALELKNSESGSLDFFTGQKFDTFGELDFDLRVGIIPLPASIWLFISALSGLGLWHRWSANILQV